MIVYTHALVLADANFPSASVCKSGPELIRADGESIRQSLQSSIVLVMSAISQYLYSVGHDIPPLLKGVMQLFPLDAYVQAPVSVTLYCI